MFVPTRKQVSLAYPVILILGCSLSVLLSEEAKINQRANYYLLNSKNVFNQILAYKGNWVWLFLFMGVAAVQYNLRTKSQSLLPTDTRALVVSNRTKLQIIKEYFCKYFLKLFILDVIFLVIDGVFIMTGGSCTVPNRSISAEHCKSLGGKWIGGFDISGHFCFLVNISMILWMELIAIAEHVCGYDTVISLSSLQNHVITVAVVVLVAWIGMLLVTATYYHTIAEKLIGCVFGYICPFVMYGLIPNSHDLNKLFYATMSD